VSEQDKRVQRRKQEDAAFNKMLLWLAGCVALEALTLLLRQVYIYHSTSKFGIGLAYALSSFFLVFRFAGAAVSVGCAVWLGLWFKNGRRGKALAAPAACTGAALWLWAVSVLCANMDFAYSAGMGMLCMLPVVVGVLAAIFFLYQREFFFNAVLGAVGISALWVFRHIYSNHPRMTWCGFAVVWVGLALAAWAAFQLNRKGGLAFGVRVLPAKTNYLLVYLTCAVCALALIAALIAGVAAAYYIMFAVIGWLFCLAVYYTVKLM